MAKNNAKGGTFIKEDVVFLEDAAGKNNKNDKEVTIATPARRTLITRGSAACPANAIIQRIPDVSSFTPIQQKMSTQSSKTIQTAVVTCKTSVLANTPTQIAASGSPCETSKLTMLAASLSSSEPIIRRTRMPQRLINAITSGTSKTAGERTIPITTEKGQKVLVKKAEAPNGRVWTRAAPAVLHTLPSSLTITPIEGSSKASTIVETHPTPFKNASEKGVLCNRCRVRSQNTDKCEHCQHTFTHTINIVYGKSSEAKDKNQVHAVVTKSSVITKDLFYGKTQDGQTSFTTSSPPCRPNNPRKYFVSSDPQGNPNPNPRGRPKGSRNKVVEPVCLTISSDEEEEPGEEGTSTSLVPYELSPTHQNTQPKFVLKSFSETPHLGKQLRRLTKQHVESINALMQQQGENMNAEEEEMMDEDEEEPELDEEEEDEEADSQYDEEMPVQDSLPTPNEIIKSRVVLQCRSIRIGSFKIHPQEDKPYIQVLVSRDGFSFQVPTVTQGEMVNICLKAPDIVQVLGHFGRCLPIMFLYTTAVSGDKIRKKLRMTKGELQYYDPDEQDEKQKRITFLIENLNDDLKTFLRHVFPGDGILSEVDQKMANEILVKSTPNQAPTPVQGTQVTQVSIPNAVQAPVQPPVQATASPQPSTIIQTVPPVKNIPVTKILTYPPPPQTGGIAITSEDMSCLDDGEFLNDAIIDFYLKYLLNEKLSETDRQRTHIFSSFFYPRLTQKPNVKSKTGEECPKTMPGKRHKQVEKWTKNLDIFEKDFIIIPINQNVHWFLAIICYPGLVPDAPEPPPNKQNLNKSTENVSSTNDQESCGSPSSDSMSLQNDSDSPVLRSMKTRDHNYTDDNSSPEDSQVSCSMNFENSECSYMEEPLPEAPDSSTHPDRRIVKQKMPCILIFDSLCGPSRWKIANHLREYLQEEWNNKKKGIHRVFDRTTMQAFIPTVPQQTNFSDCGIYVLQYVESFFEKPFPYLGSPMPKLYDWFTAETVATKREGIRSLIQDLQKRLSSSGTPVANASKPVTRKEVAKSVVVTPTIQTVRLTPS